MENPTVATVSDEVKRAVLDRYAQLQHVDVSLAEAGFAGGIPFDSILGVEMAASLEVTLGVAIPEERLTRTSIYASLASFAAMVQTCVDTAKK
jgi:acyl carrier protein